MEVWKALIEVTGWGLALVLVGLVPVAVAGLAVGLGGRVRDDIEDWWERRKCERKAQNYDA